MGIIKKAKKIALIAVLALTLNANANGEGSPLISGVKKPDTNYVEKPIRLEPEKKTKINYKELFYGRADYNFMTRFNPLSLNAYRLESISRRELMTDTLAREAKSIFKNSAEQALRETFLEYSDLNILSHGLRQRAGGIFTGREERNTLISPFDAKEGLPGYELTEDRLPSKRLKFGARPFRTKPMVFTTLNLEYFVLHGRTDYRRWEIDALLPLPIDKFALSVGVRRDLREGNGEISFGLGKNLGEKGIFYLGTTFNRDVSVGLGFRF